MLSASAHGGRSFLFSAPDWIQPRVLFGAALPDATGRGYIALKGSILESTGGVLFLDELDTLSHRSQIRLAETLQSSSVRPCDSHETLDVDLHLITGSALTAESLQSALVPQLWFQLVPRVAVLPPLCGLTTQLADVVAFIATWRLRLRGVHMPPLSAGALTALASRTWSAGMIELESCLERTPLPMKATSPHRDRRVRRDRGNSSGDDENPPEQVEAIQGTWD